MGCLCIYLISSINSICSSISKCLPNLPYSLSLVQSTVFCPSTSRCLLDLPHTHNNYSHLHLVNILHWGILHLQNSEMYEYSDHRYFASLNSRSRLVDRIFGNVPWHYLGVRFSGVIEQDMIPCLVLVHPRKTCHSMTEKCWLGCKEPKHRRKKRFSSKTCIDESLHEILVLVAPENSKGSDESLYPCSLSRAIAAPNRNKSKKGGKDEESIQSSTTPDPGYHMGKWQTHN